MTKVCSHIDVSNNHLNVYRYVEEIVTPTCRFVHSLELFVDTHYVVEVGMKVVLSIKFYCLRLCLPSRSGRP